MGKGGKSLAGGQSERVEASTSEKINPYLEKRVARLSKLEPVELKRWAKEYGLSESLEGKSLIDALVRYLNSWLLLFLYRLF